MEPDSSGKDTGKVEALHDPRNIEPGRSGMVAGWCGRFWHHVADGSNGGRAPLCRLRTDQVFRRVKPDLIFSKEN
jgi:hypothetical protein